MKTRGFTLMEVAMSLGIFAFCLVAVLGLFSTGLKTERSSHEEDGATSTLAALSLALENSTRDGSGKYTTVAPLPAWPWDPAAGGKTSGKLGNYAYWMEVRQVNRVGYSRLVRAHLEVAWPPDKTTWDEQGKATQAVGSVSQNILFYAR